MRLSLFKRTKAEAVIEPVRRPRMHSADDYQPAPPTRFDEDTLKRQFQYGRYAYILDNRKQWSRHFEIDAVCSAAEKAIDEQFPLVPDGYVSLPQTIQDDPGCPEKDFQTAPFLLARHTVTNAEFQNFVDGGGYENLDLWPQEVWPQLMDFRDLTDQPGPRFWRHGRHDLRLADHPVVGVCWHEATAYCRWAGLRLPTEVEWQMAATWRLRTFSQMLRRYPWGDAFDVRRCNVWASGTGGTVPVWEYSCGAAPNGVMQLIGNVWEWMASDFDATHEAGQPVVGDMLLKGVRGGAFDTYFAAQATSVFRTGLATMTRAHNVGFRCALDPRLSPE